jgi:hypothetical protein
MAGAACSSTILMQCRSPDLNSEYYSPNSTLFFEPPGADFLTPKEIILIFIILALDRIVQERQHSYL